GARRVVGQVVRVVSEFGARCVEVGSGSRWCVGGGTVADFGLAALGCAAFFAEPGPAATGVPLPRHARPGQQIKIEAVAMLGEDGRHLPRRHSWPDSLWDWHVHLPYKHRLAPQALIFPRAPRSL